MTAAQLLAGASGPVLDIFDVQSDMTREQILGTKAVTQTLGHILKLIYYGAVMAVASTELPLWVVPAVVAAAILGNYLASLVVARMTDNQFKQIGRYVIMVIGGCLYRERSSRIYPVARTLAFNSRRCPSDLRAFRIPFTVKLCTE